MARPVSFDRDAVVSAARTLFWRDGYEASIPDLERATGLARSSIYNTFGSKRGLFDEAVQSYLDDVIRPRLRPLESDPVSPEAVVDYLTGLREAFRRPESMTATSGCLLINSAGTPIARDPHVARVIAEYREELQSALARGISAHARHAEADAQQRAGAAVTALVISAFALARVDPAQAVRTLDAALDVLDRLA